QMQKDLLVTDEPAFHDREAGVDPAACSTLLQFRALGPVGDPQPQPDLSRRSVRDPDPDQTIIGVIGTDLEPEDSTIVQRCPPCPTAAEKVCHEAKVRARLVGQQETSNHGARTPLSARGLRPPPSCSNAGMRWWSGLA